MKSKRNKTIDLPLEHGQEYLARCRLISEKQSIETIRDQILLGDTFSILPMLPEKSVDLLIVDPPYNMQKEFHGSTFSAISA